MLVLAFGGCCGDYNWCRIGFLDLWGWLELAGIGVEARRLQIEYGDLAPIILNLGAMMSFLVIAVVFYIYHRTASLTIITRLISLIFISRGLTIVFLIMDEELTSTLANTVLFSLIAFIVGLIGLLSWNHPVHIKNTRAVSSEVGL